jgi:hypothetical protein
MAKLNEDVTEFEKVNEKLTEFDTAFGFPTEFPYEFDSFETENSDEEDFFAGLTRRLSQTSLNETRKQLSELSAPIFNTEKPEIHEKVRVMAGSPQSTLAGIGSWSGRSGGSSDGSPNGSTRVPSPTTIPLSTGNDAWEVLYAAAGEVARLKMNNEASLFEFQNKRGVLGGVPPPLTAENRAAMFFGNPNPSHVQYNQVKQQCDSIWGRQAQAQAQAKEASWLAHQVQNRGYDYEGMKCMRALPRSAWHSPMQVKNHQNNPGFFNGSGSGSRPGLQNGSGVKRGCGGTGVFLPRPYGTPLPESRKKTSCAPVLVPAKVIHALNLNIDDFNGGRQPRFSNDFSVDYDALLARKNALVLQQRLRMQREEAASYENRLPQEWTY